MKIDELLDYAYNSMIERLNIVEESPRHAVYRTMAMERNNPTSYTFAYMNYYTGVFEGIFFTSFLEEFDRMPTPSENQFIIDSFSSRFEKFKDVAIRYAKKAYDKDNS